MTRTTGYGAGLFAGVLVLAAACDARRSATDTYAPGTEAPPASITNPLAPEQRGAVLDYARDLKFDSLPHGARDRQRLTRRDLVTRREVLGPIAEILPERRSRGNTGPALQRGRIVARITSDGPYATLGLPAGVSYLWIDSLGTTEDAVGRAIVIPADSSVPARRLPVLFWLDPHAAHGREPAARWYYAEGRSEFAWLTCVTNGCCVVGAASREGITFDEMRD